MKKAERYYGFLKSVSSPPGDRNRTAASFVGSVEGTGRRCLEIKKHSRLAALACLILALMTAGAAPAEEQAEASFDRVGSIVTFGRYEQDGDEENGPEGIRWIVLDTQEGKSLLLSLYGLDAAPYHPKSKNITWKDCALRKWLNGEFLQTAFTKEEQQAILTTKVDNSASQGYSRWNTTV